MWNQDELEVNKLKEKVCMVNYKSQNASYNQIYKESSNAFQEIQPSFKKAPQASFNKKTASKTSPPQLPEQEIGINLFKAILLKNSKALGLKRTETLMILRRKVASSLPDMTQEYSLA